MFNNFNMDKIIYALVYILIAVVFYFVLTKVIKVILQNPREKLNGKLNTRQIQRMSTLQELLNSATKYLVIIALILALLANFGVDVSSLLAGIGIATIIVGLAFQDLAKDIIAGFSIIMDNQYEVGDLIEVDGFKGRVTSVGLKSTKIKNYRGKELIIANRNMNSMINYSTHNTLAEVDVPVAYEVDSEQVEKIIEKICAEIEQEKPEGLVGEVTYLGPVELDDSFVIWRINAECLPYKHFATQRLIRRLVLAEFKKSGIKVPYKRVEISQKK